MTFTVIIPARFDSTRLPGKALLDLNGKPIIQHVYEQAKKSHAKQVLIATDDARIIDAAKSFCAETVLTSKAHKSGTERLSEVIKQHAFASDEIIVNVQGDEPFIPPEHINQVANNLASQEKAVVATLASKITQPDEIFNPNVVKVVTNHDQLALYFSRAPIPWERDAFNNPENVMPNDTALKHIGIYAYRAHFLASYKTLAPSPLETLESLEQLRVLWHGYQIHVGLSAVENVIGIDTPADLERARALLANH